MAHTITISQPSQMSPNLIRKAVDEVFDDLKSRYTISGEWAGDRLFVINGEGITGRLEVHQNGVTLSITLGGILASFGGMIENQLRDKLHDRLNP